MDDGPTKRSFALMTSRFSPCGASAATVGSGTASSTCFTSHVAASWTLRVDWR